MRHYTDLPLAATAAIRDLLNRLEADVETAREAVQDLTRQEDALRRESRDIHEAFRRDYRRAIHDSELASIRARRATRRSGQSETRRFET
ncbi:MAG: hypothetical protein AAGI52_17315 [Bacteroidota bacterium]